MARFLFIGNLGEAVSDQDLALLFERCLSVKNAAILRSLDGRSRGIGRVEISDESTGAATIERLNGTEYNGRTLTVRWETFRDASDTDRAGRST